MAVGTKLVGCGLPSTIFLKDKGKAMKVGIGMISRGEISLIVARQIPLQESCRIACLIQWSS
ncbi:MAG: hypothetical protein AB1351_04030 [Thermoproteota archaeon]